MSESDFSIYNAIGVKKGMQNMKTCFNLNFTVNATRYYFETDFLSPVELPSVGVKRGLAAMHMMFDDHDTVRLAACREYG